MREELLLDVPYRQVVFTIPTPIGGKSRRQGLSVLHNFLLPQGPEVRLISGAFERLSSFLIRHEQLPLVLDRVDEL